MLIALHTINQKFTPMATESDRLSAAAPSLISSNYPYPFPESGLTSVIITPQQID